MLSDESIITKAPIPAFKMVIQNCKISFVVLSYNRADIIEKNIGRLLEIDWPQKEIIIVDNCSTDGSRELLRNKYSNFPEIQIIESPINSGVCRGRNLGFKKASGDYIIYLDDDSIAPLDICEKTVELFDANSDAACIGYVIKSMPEGRLINNLDVRKLGSYWGGAHAFRKAIFGQAGYLDETFFFGCEEMEHSIAIRQAGYEVILGPQVIVEHFGNQPSGKAFAKRAANWIADMNFIYIKWFPWKHALPLFFRQLLAMSIASIKRGVISPIFAGLWLTAKGFRAALEKRKVMSYAILAFYLDPQTKPKMYRVPFATFWSKYYQNKAEKK